jgi:hypothetical protein
VAREASLRRCPPVRYLGPCPENVISVLAPAKVGVRRIEAGQRESHGFVRFVLVLLGVADPFDPSLGDPASGSFLQDVPTDSLPKSLNAFRTRFRLRSSVGLFKWNPSGLADDHLSSEVMVRTCASEALKTHLATKFRNIA